MPGPWFSAATSVSRFAPSFVMAKDWRMRTCGTWSPPTAIACTGHRLRPLDALIAVVTRTLEGKHGNVLVPSFAVGRTQELLYWFERLMFAGRLPPLNVIVDSPLAQEVTERTQRHQEL